MAVSNWENPVLSRELRQRMRGSKAFWLLFAFVGVLAAILGATYYTTSGYQSHNAGGTSEMGRQFYTMLFMVQAGLVCLITPALTSGALTLERENRTYEAMEVSLLPRRSIVAGKLASALSFVLFLLSASFPLSAMTFLLGGVAPQEIAVAYLVLAVSAFVYGSLGLAFSSFVKSTVTSTLVSYFAAVAVFLLTGILTAVGSSNLTSGTPIPGRACLVAFNPMGAIGAATMSESYFGLLVPSWLTSLVMNAFLGTLFFLTALHRLEYPKSDRSTRLRGLTAGFVALTTLGLCGSFIGALLFGNATEGAAYVLILLALVGPVLACLFATGSGRDDSGWLALRSGAPRSGLLFAILTVALSLTIAGATILSDWGLKNFTLVLHPALVTLAATFGIGGLGLALSAWTKNRWVAMAIAFGVAALLFGIPITNYETTGDVTASPWGHRFLFLSAPAGVSDAFYHGDGFRKTTDWIGREFWQMTVGFYALLGAAAIAVANRKGRESGVSFTQGREKPTPIV